MPAFAPRADPGQDGFDAVQHSVEVDVQRPVPVGIARLGDRPKNADPGVVTQHVDAAEGALRFVRRAGVGLAVRHIERHDVGAVQHSRFLQLPPGRFTVVFANIRDHRVHARLNEDLDHTQPDAAGAGRDERRLALDLAHLIQPSSPPSASAIALASAVMRARRSSLALRFSSSSKSMGNACSISSKYPATSARNSPWGKM